MIESEHSKILEPLNENMTVEEYMSNFVERLKADVRVQGDYLKAKLDSEFETGKDELMTAHREVLASMNQPPQGNRPQNVDNLVKDENNCDDNSALKIEVHPTMTETTKTLDNKTSASSSVAVTKGSASTGILSGIHVEISTGPHANSTHELYPRPRAPCFIGRSTGKKFRERGISISDDLEVSTTHGKFEIKKGRAFFTDIGSTNGSFFKDKLMEVGDPLELEDGLMIRLGSSELRIALMYT